MSALRAVPVLDPQPVLDLIRERGGVCTFDEALRMLAQRGFSEASARDALWQFLSDGRLEFTQDRQLTVP
jgi:DNA-binding transcriptional regulator PaaX